MVQRHFGRVYQHAFRLTRNKHDAEDLTQDTFVQVFRAWSTYRPGSVDAWLHRITTNLFINGYRRSQRVHFGPPIDETTPGLPGAGRSPADILDDRLLDPDIETALANVSPTFRETVILSDLAGLSRIEIARLIGVKPATVSTRLHRGRKQLRVSLAHRLTPARS